jgi:hypothetical protein
MKPTLLILAAGLGSRYGGLKQVDSLGPGGATLMDYAIYDAYRAGFTRVILVVRRHFQEQIMNLVRSKWESRLAVDSVIQELDCLPEGFQVPPGREKPWGTAHALLMAASEILDPFAVINADDYYGPGSYRQLVTFFRSLPAPDSTRFAVVGFQLQHTLSEHGSVSRGICQVDEQDNLKKVVERLKVERRPDGIAWQDETGSWHPLDEATPVSMNMMGFTPSVFGPLLEYFRQFLDSSGSDLTAEFYLPLLLERLISEKRAAIQVLPNTDRWFGVTYREDREAVRGILRSMTDEGHYPEVLWT